MNTEKAKLVLNNLVQITFPELNSLFSSIYGGSAIAILKEYGTPIKLAKAHISKVSSLLHGRCRCSASDIIEAAKHSLGISDDCYAFEIMDAIENLEFIQHRIEKYDIQIKQLVDELCPNLLTVPGIGYVTAGLIAGEIGDAERFHNAESLISFSGVDVTVYGSGNYKAKHLIPSKKSSRYLRYALFQVARIIWIYDPVFKAYYEKKLAEGKHYYVILGHIQKKLCRLVYSLMKSGNNYEIRS
jgi:transposase